MTISRTFEMLTPNPPPTLTRYPPTDHTRVGKQIIDFLEAVHDISRTPGGFTPLKCPSFGPRWVGGSFFLVGTIPRYIRICVPNLVMIGPVVWPPILDRHTHTQTEFVLYRYRFYVKLYTKSYMEIAIKRGILRKLPHSKK